MDLKVKAKNVRCTFRNYPTAATRGVISLFHAVTFAEAEELAIKQVILHFPSP